MESVELICPNCGAKIQAIDNRRAIRCEHCGVAILIEDVMDSALQEQAPSVEPESAAQQNKPGKPWSLMAAAACLLFAVLVFVGVYMARRPAAAVCLDEDAIPAALDKAADAIVDEDIGEMP